MSERKVLNKYYPPDFDPSKIPKLRLPRNRQYSIRIMSPFNMRCNTCGEYIYKGKKFNSRKETVEDEEYLGLKIFRFYIKCPRCVAEIAFKTDPQNTDYALEGGATRNFEAMRTAEMLARQEIEAKEAEEANNPMKVLENRTKQSQQEMEMIETLEELRELNTRHAKVDHDSIVQLHRTYEEQLAKLQDEEDEKLIRNIFGKGANSESVKRLQDDDDGPSGLEAPPVKKMATGQKPTDFLTEGSGHSHATSVGAKPKTTAGSWGQPPPIVLPKKSALAGLVRRKMPAPGVTTASTPGATTGNNTSSTPGGTTDTSKATVNGSVCSPASMSNTKPVSNSPCGPVASGPTSTHGVQQTGAAAGVTAPLASGLGLLGAYSDSDSNSDDSN